MNCLTYSMWTRESFPECMERNFRKVNGTPYWPIRFWRNRIGPGEVSLIAIAMARKIGDRMINAVELPAASMIRLITRGTRFASSRSEERRVGKECRSRGAPCEEKKKERKRNEAR